MKNPLILLLVIGLQCVSFAQKKADSERTVGFGCYVGGEPSRAVTKITQLIESNGYNSISELLHSGNEGERYLAGITLQRLNNIGIYEINKEEKDLIEKLQKSLDLVSVCEGCTYFDEVPMHILFSDKDLIGTNRWLERTIKKN
ncbi:MAG TPA: hypothetical protein VFW11_08945 [Cyclobacteriaceae bacterium]|nr:hypothetical protein [Cyclobacteriaceae bacterium]